MKLLLKPMLFLFSLLFLLLFLCPFSAYAALVPGGEEDSDKDFLMLRCLEGVWDSEQQEGVLTLQYGNFEPFYVEDTSLIYLWVSMNEGNDWYNLSDFENICISNTSITWSHIPQALALNGEFSFHIEVPQNPLYEEHSAVYHFCLDESNPEAPIFFNLQDPFDGNRNGGNRHMNPTVEDLPAGIYPLATPDVEPPDDDPIDSTPTPAPTNGTTPESEPGVSEAPDSAFPTPPPTIPVLPVETPTVNPQVPILPSPKAAPVLSDGPTGVVSKDSNPVSANQETDASSPSPKAEFSASDGHEAAIKKSPDSPSRNVLTGIGFFLIGNLFAGIGFYKRK